MGPSRPIPCPCGHALLKWHILNLHYNFHIINSHWKWGTEAPEAHGAQVIQILGLIRWPTPTKLVKSSNICFIDFHQNELLRLQNPSGSPLLGPLDHGVSLGGLKTDQIAMVRSQQLLCYKFPLIVSDHGSRRTWGPSPSGSGFGVQKGDRPPLNQGRPATFI